MIDTFNALITATGTQKIFLIEIEPSEYLINWTLYSGSIYYNDVGYFDVKSVYEDGSALTLATSITGVTAGKYFYQNGRLYVRATSGDIYSKIIVVNYKLYYSDSASKGRNNEDVIFNNCFYEARILAIPIISQKKTDLFWGISIISDGQFSLENSDGHFDSLYERFLWDNKPVTILCGGEDLPYSEYQKMFQGIISDKNLTMKMFDLAFTDSKTEWETNIPLNSFDQTTYPNLEDEDVGKPIPLRWGTVRQVPAICTTRKLGTATSMHTFKIADTSLHSIYAIDQVYVKGNKVSHLSGSVNAATFKLPTSTYNPGDAVACDLRGFKSGTVMIENPISILKEIGTVLIGVTWGSTRWETATINQAVVDSAEFPIGLSVDDRKSANDVAGEIVQSCLGTFYVNNSGKYVASIWSTDNPTAPSSVSDFNIFEGTVKAVTQKDNIRKTIFVGFSRNWSDGTLASLSRSSDTTEKLYGITKSKSVPTLLSTNNGAQLMLDRLMLLFEGATIKLSFSSALQLALKNIGDRIQVTFKRHDAATNISWLDSKLVEIFEIKKRLGNGVIEITADDLKGIGGFMGHWTSDTPEFPAYLGGGSAETWDPTWSMAKKSFAKSQFEYYCDDNGFIDPTDPDSRNLSKWW